METDADDRAHVGGDASVAAAATTSQVTQLSTGGDTRGGGAGNGGEASGAVVPKESQDETAGLSAKQRKRLRQKSKGEKRQRKFKRNQ